MLHTVVSFDDIYYDYSGAVQNRKPRSTNPYDYIRKGWFLDNLSVYRGLNNVNLKSDYSGDFAGYIHNSSR
ncbi:MAG: hypothetical protein IJR60_08205 [Eubacterium sp.]|nr:hypothetical protein [Eubacterium sp.]